MSSRKPQQDQVRQDEASSHGDEDLDFAIEDAIVERPRSLTPAQEPAPAPVSAAPKSAIKVHAVAAAELDAEPRSNADIEFDLDELVAADERAAAERLAARTRQAALEQEEAARKEAAEQRAPEIYDLAMEDIEFTDESATGSPQDADDFDLDDAELLR